MCKAWGCRLAIGSVKLAYFLRLAGIMDNKTFTVKPWSGPDHLLPHWWRGCIDGDGSIGFYNGEWRIGLVGNRHMVNGFARWVKSTIGGTVAKVFPRQTIFGVSFGGSLLPQKIVRALYGDCTIALERKRLLAKQLMAMEFKEVGHPELTLEVLTRLKVEHGRWDDVAQTVGMTRRGLKLLRDRRARGLTH